MLGKTSFATVFVLGAVVAHAEVVATCGASKGHAYYIPGQNVPVEEAGWTADGVSKGSFQLIRSGDDWDIVFTDASGGTLTSRTDGGKVSAIISKNGDVIVQIVYAVSIETYVFWLSLKKPVASYSQAKFAALIQKHGLMVAPCRLGA